MGAHEDSDLINYIFKFYMFVCFQFCFVLLHTAFILVTNLLFGDFLKILVLWIFLFPVHSLLFVILPTIPHCGLFLPVYGKLSSVVIVFFFGILHLSPGLWKFYHRTVFQMLLSVITDTSPVQAKFYISFSASISPHQVEGKVHSSAMAGPDLGLSWFRGLFSPGASGRELLTASLGLSAKFCSPFHCGDIFARVLNRVLILPCLLSWSQDHASLCIRKAVDICQLCFFFFYGKNLCLSSDS